LLGAAGPLGGCADLNREGLIAQRDRAAALQADLAARVESLDQAAAALPAGSPERAEFEAQARAAEAQRAALEAILVRADQVLAEADDPTHPVTRTAQTVAGWLPEPVRSPVLLGAALLATVLRARQLKKGASSIARSIEKAMANDPTMKEALVRNAATIRSIQTPTAQRIVDEATKPGRTLSLPI
jgi:hypothetical protein